MNSRTFFFDKKIIAVSLLYFLAGGFILFKYGIQLGGEAEKYIDNAHRILNGHELRNGIFGIFYFVYSLLVSVFISLHINLVFVAVIQLLISFLAAIALYKIIWHAFANRTLAFIFFCAFLFCYPVQKWNFYLFSESLHTSILVFGMYYFQKALMASSIRNWLLLSIFILLIIFSRPVGVIFLLSAMLAFAFWMYSQSKKVLAGIIIIAMLASFIGLTYSPLASFVNPDSLKRMEVICQVPETNVDANYTEFNEAGLYEVYKVIRDDIGWGGFFKTGINKLGCFYGMGRPYYSWSNNGLLLLYLIFYPFAIIGIFSKRSTGFKSIKWLSVLYLLFTSFAIFFTCDDWANRFISPAFPFILLLAANGLYLLMKKPVNPEQAN